MFEYPNEGYNNHRELEFLMPTVRRLLNHTTGELKVIIRGQLYAGHINLNTKYKDFAEKTVGYTPNLPFININGKTKYCPGYGLTLYRNRLNPEIKYVYVCLLYGTSWVEYIIVPAGQLWKLARNFKRQAFLYQDKPKPPILATGVLEELLKNSVDFLRKKKLFKKYGVNLQRGILLDGPPGNGKTMACRYIQSKCLDYGINCGTVTSSALSDAFGRDTLTQLFNNAGITFFDDIDIGFLNRNKGNGAMACAILAAMDGVEIGNPCVRIFTTNEKIKDLDPAFVRPGRIDRCISFNKPSASLRLQLISTWPDQIKNNIDVNKLLYESHDFSFAELELLRTFLVSNYLLEDGLWDLDNALNEFRGRKNERQMRPKVGFAA